MSDEATPLTAMVDRLLEGLEASGGGILEVRWTDGGSGSPGPTWDHSVERLLVRSAAAGDDEALDVLICREWCGVYRLVARHQPDPVMAEELVQEVFTRAIASLERLQELGVPFRSYLAQIARRLVRDRIGMPKAEGPQGGRSGRSGRGVPGAFGATSVPGLVVLPAPERTSVTRASATPNVLVLSPGERHRFLELLDRLPRRSRELLWLRVMEGRTEAEIAIAWGRTPEVVRDAQRQALDALRAGLANHPEGTT